MTWRSNNTNEQQGQQNSLGMRVAQVLIVLAIVVAGGGGILIGIISVVAPDVLNRVVGGLSGLPVQQTQAVSGNPSRFDPYKALAEAQAFAAKDVQLISITANYVRSDGTMDLTATYKPGPSTEYKFIHQVPPPSNAPPIGAGGNASGIWYERVTITAYQPGQRSSIREFNGTTSLSYTFVNAGYSRETNTPTSTLSDSIITAPQCSLAQFWKVAIQKYDVPPNAVAVVEYAANGYDFSISDTSVSIMFDNQCQPR